MKKYELLKKKYPEYISLDQLYRICKIAKRSAIYLIQHGIIPVIETGKKTWRYKISLDDVIIYLQRRDEIGSMIPRGAVKSRPTKTVSNRKSFSQIIKPGQEWEIAEYFEYIYSDYGDVLTTADIVEMTGLNKSTVLKLLKSGQIKFLSNKPTYLIPKQYLLKFVVTRRFIESQTISETFKKVLGGFEIWKNAKSSR
ncbi:MAG: helix-turn-helix domain-containing protein [Oscillospiraceae bacterium]|nr:helix-turn-helix domain-containing protein [Oscillospiraceae bacterium]